MGSQAAVAAEIGGGTDMTGKRTHTPSRGREQASPRRRVASPSSAGRTAGANPILQLQAAAGNRAVVDLIESGALRSDGAPRITVARQADSATAAPPRLVSEMSSTEKLVEALHRAKIDEAVREKLLSVLSPEALVAAIVAFAAVFVAAQFTPVGWAADLGVALTAVFVGTALFSAIRHLVNFASARNATTSAELDQAGAEFARAIAEIEVDAVILLVTHGISGGSGGGRPIDGPPTAGGLVLATTGGGRLVPVAVETIPPGVAAELGLRSGALMMSQSNQSGGAQKGAQERNAPPARGDRSRKDPEEGKPGPDDPSAVRRFADGIPYTVRGAPGDASSVGGTSVYVLKDASGTVLYVGEGSVWERLAAHIRDFKKTDWIGEIAQIEIRATNLTKKQSLALEEDLIQLLNPLHNVDRFPFQKAYGWGESYAPDLRGTAQRILRFQVEVGSPK